MRKKGLSFICLSISVGIYLLVIQLVSIVLLPIVTTSVISRYLPYNSSLSGVKVKIIPYPEIEFSHIGFISPSLNIRASQVRVAPEMVRLIKGAPFLKINIANGDIDFIYKPKSRDHIQRPPFPLFSNRYISHLNLKDGTASVYFKGHVLNFNLIHAQIYDKSKSLYGKIYASSNMSKNIFFEFNLTKHSFSFSSHIKRAILTSYIFLLFPKTSKWLKGSLNANLCLKGKFYNNKLIVHSILTSQSISFVKGCKIKKPFIEFTIQTKFYTSSPSIDFYIKDLRILHPDTKIVGSINYAPSILKINLYAPFIDYSSWLKEYHKSGIKVHIIDSISKIVTSGKIKKIRFYLSREEKHPMRWGIMGEVEDTKVAVPSVDLRLSRVYGNFYVRNNILYCIDTSGMVKGSRFYNTNLILGLNHSVSPFDLKVNTRFNLEELTSLLRQVHVSPRVQERLEKLKIDKGICIGQVHVWKEKGHFYVEVKARDISLQGEVNQGEIPFFLTGSFFHLNTRDGYIQVKDIEGKIGTTQINDAFLALMIDRGVFTINMASRYMCIPEMNRFISSIFNTPSLTRYIGKGRIQQVMLNLNYSYKNNRLLDFNASGKINILELKRDLFSMFLANYGFPFRYMRLSKGNFFISPTVISMKDMDVAVRDSYFYINKLDFVKKQKRIKVNISGRGRAGRDIQFFMKEQIPILKKIHLKFLLNIKKFQIIYESHTIMSLSLSLTLNPDSLLSIYLTNKIANHSIRGEMNIKTRGREELAVECVKAKDEVCLQFKGLLTHRVFDSLLMKNPWIGDRISGDFVLRFNISPFSITSFKGGISLYDIALKGWGVPLHIKKAHLKGRGREVQLIDGDICLDGDSLYAAGELHFGGKENLFDLRIRGKKWNLDHFLSSLVFPRGRSNKWGVRGKIKVTIDRLSFLDRNIKDVRAIIRVKNKRGVVLLNRASLGGLPLKGEAKISHLGVRFFLSVNAKSVPVARALKEIFQRKHRIITGNATVDLGVKGCVFFDKKGSSIYPDLFGSIDILIKDGRIYKLTLLSRILAILNSTEILFGNLPSLDKEGFGYKHLHSKGKIEKGVLYIERSVIDGDTMDIIFHGKVYLKTRTLKMLAFIAPLKTIDRLVKRIPLVNSVLKGHLLLIPVSISGKLDDPTVIPLSPTALTSEVFQILKNILKLPFTILKPSYKSPSEKLIK